MPRPRDDDDYEDDVPRRRRNRDYQDEEDYSDEPRRRTPPKKGVNVLGIISIIVGILGLLISLIPCIGLFVGLPIAIIGLLLGVIGIFVGKESGRGLPITGSTVSFVAILISVAWFAYGYFSVKKAQKQAEAEMQASRLELDRAARDAEKQENDRRELDRIRTETRNAKAVQVTAEQLIDEFTNNMNAAMRRYTNQIVEVTIKVSDFTERPEFKAKSIRFKDPAGKFDVVCTFKEHIRDELNGIKAGDTVVLRGKLGFMGEVIGLVNCTVMQKGKGTGKTKKGR